jgi:hypothetical protein
VEFLGNIGQLGVVFQSSTKMHGCKASKSCWVFMWPTQISGILGEILVNWWGI